MNNTMKESLMKVMLVLVFLVIDLCMYRLMMPIIRSEFWKGVYTCWFFTGSVKTVRKIWTEV